MTRRASAADPDCNLADQLRTLRTLVTLQDELLARAARRLELLEARMEQQQPTRAPDAFIPIAEAAARAGLSVRTLKRLIARGAVVGRALHLTGRLRSRWLVDSDSLAAFLSTGARTNAE